MFCRVSSYRWKSSEVSHQQAEARQLISAVAFHGRIAELGNGLSASAWSGRFAF